MITTAQFNRFFVIATALDLGWARATARPADPGSPLWHARSDYRHTLTSLAGCRGEPVIDVAWLGDICDVAGTARDGIPTPAPVPRLTADGWTTEPGAPVGDYVLSTPDCEATIRPDGSGSVAIGDDVLRLVAPFPSPVYRRRPSPSTDLAHRVFCALCWSFQPDGEPCWDGFDLPSPEGISLAILSEPGWEPDLTVDSYDTRGQCPAYGVPVPCSPWHDERVSPLVPHWGGEDDPRRYVWTEGRPAVLGRRGFMGPLLMTVWMRDLDAAMRALERTRAEWPHLAALLTSEMG